MSDEREGTLCPFCHRAGYHELDCSKHKPAQPTTSEVLANTKISSCESQVRECITHYFACDCREADHGRLAIECKRLAGDLADLEERFRKYKDYATELEAAGRALSKELEELKAKK